LRNARALGPRLARLQTLFELMAQLDDTNLAHRGGLQGLRWAQQQARDFLAAGGAARPDAIDHAQRLHAAFVARRLSPGGTADLLAAACWLDRVCTG
ncbi:MAG: triphosphoribosyl-dephospho-CoA synthase, partial [Burkholderiales bacterium]|nr:triphosphoribosyl-dephospho-CoA synthase [Burkholderiales bacterium]